MFSQRIRKENRAWVGGVSFVVAAAMILSSTVDVWALRTEAAGGTPTTKAELGETLWEYGFSGAERKSAGLRTDERIAEAYARKAAINLIGHQAVADEDLAKAVKEYIEISGEEDLSPEALVERLIRVKDFFNRAVDNDEFLLRLFNEVSEAVKEGVKIGNIKDEDLVADDEFLKELIWPDWLESSSRKARNERLRTARKIFIEDTRWPVLLLGKRAGEISLYSLGDPQSETHKAVVAHSGAWAYEGSEDIRGGARSNYYAFARLEGYAKRGEEGLAVFQDEAIHEFKDWVRGWHKDEAPEITARVNKINREIDKELKINGKPVYEEVRGGLGREPSAYGPHPMQIGLWPLYEKISWARNHANRPQFVIKNIYAFRDQKHGMAPVDAISFGIVLGDDTFIVQNAPVMGGLSAGGLEPDTHPTVKAAIEFFNKNVSPRLKGLTIAQPDKITEMIIKIDEEFNAQSEDKTLPRFSYIGAELAVGISMISTVALAEVLHVPTEVIINYRYNEYAMSHGLAKESRPMSIPVDFSVVWEGGKHGVAKNLPDLVKEGIIKDDKRFPARFKDAELINKGDKSILLAMVPPQELQILCFAPDWDSAYDIGVKLTNTYQKLLKDNGIKTKYGAESGFTTEQVRTADGRLITLELVLGVLEQAVSSLKPDEAKYVRYALDIAASEMYVPEIDMYYIGPDAAKKVDPANVDGLVTNEQFTQYKLMLFKAHPRFISCEDWAADDQITHWDPSAKLIMEKMIQMGDDLNVSRGDLILKHNALGIQNAHLHKPNQVSEERASMEAVATSHNLNNVVVWSHRGTRSPQETFTAQGAMGTGSLGSKFTLWGPGRSALIAIMTQANKMYRELGIKVPYQGAMVLDPNGPYKNYGWAKRLREEIGKADPLTPEPEGMGSRVDISGSNEIASGAAPIKGEDKEPLLPDKQNILEKLRNPVPQTTYEVVISDFSSDTDTVVSTIAEAQRIKKAAELKGFNDIIVFPVIQGKLNDETLFILKEAGINPADLIFLAEDNVEDLLSALAGHDIAGPLHLTFNITLTDHSKLTGKKDNLQILNERIVRVIDHHPISDKIKPAEAIYDKVGSTNTLIFERFVKGGVPIPKNAGLLMLSAILSDTKNLAVNTTDRDKKAVEELRNIVGYSEQAQKELFIRQTHALNTIEVDNPLEKIFSSDNLRHFPDTQNPKYSFTTFRLNHDEKTLFEGLWPQIIKYLYKDLRERNLDVAFFNLTHLNEQGGLSDESEELYIVGKRNKVTTYLDAAGIPYQGTLRAAGIEKGLDTYLLKHKGQAARKETVKKIADYFSYIKAEDTVYSVSGGEALDKLVEKTLADAREILKKPKLKISIEKKSDSVIQVIWKFGSITVTKNFRFGKTASIDIDEIVREVDIIKSYWEVNNFDLRKEEDYKNACEVITGSLGGDELEFVIEKLLPAMKKELSNSKKIQRIEEEPRVFLVTPDVFRKGGARNALRKAAELNGVANVKIAFYSDKTEELRDVLGIENENTITAKNLDELLKEFSKRNIEPAKVIALITPEDKDSEDSAKLKAAGIRQIVTPGITTLAVAKAINEAFSDFDFVRQAFNQFLSKILIEDKIILPINPFAHSEIIGGLKEGVFVFPQVELKPEITKAVQDVIDTATYKEFIKKFV